MTCASFRQYQGADGNLHVPLSTEALDDRSLFDPTPKSVTSSASYNLAMELSAAEERHLRLDAEDKLRQAEAGLQATKAWVQRHLDAVEQERQRMTEYQQDAVRFLQRENRALREECRSDDAPEATTEENPRRIAELESRLRESEAACARQDKLNYEEIELCKGMAEASEASQCRSAELQQRVDASQSASDSSERKVSELQQRLEMAERSLTESQRRADDALSREAALQTVCQGLEADLKSATQEVRSLEQYRDHADSARQRDASLQKDVDAARARETELLAAAEAARVREVELSANLEAARAREAVLLTDVEAFRTREKEFLISSDAARKREAEFLANAEHARRREAELQFRCQQLQDALDAKTNEAIAMTKDLSAKHTEVERLHLGALEAAKRDAEVVQLVRNADFARDSAQEESCAAEARAASLSNELDRVRKECAAQITALSQELDKAGKECHELRQALAVERERHGHRVQEVSNHMQAVDDEICAFEQKLAAFSLAASTGASTVDGKGGRWSPTQASTTRSNTCCTSPSLSSRSHIARQDVSMRVAQRLILDAHSEPKEEVAAPFDCTLDNMTNVSHTSDESAKSLCQSARSVGAQTPVRRRAWSRSKAVDSDSIVFEESASKHAGVNGDHLTRVPSPARRRNHGPEDAMHIMEFNRAAADARGGALS